MDERVMDQRIDSTAQRHNGSPQLVRQWAILVLLQRREYSVRELAQELGASKSSIQRDIAVLQEHFMVVAKSAGRQKRVYQLERRRSPIDVHVTSEELSALSQAIARATCERETRALGSLRCKVAALVRAPGP